MASKYTMHYDDHMGSSKQYVCVLPAREVLSRKVSELSSFSHKAVTVVGCLLLQHTEIMMMGIVFSGQIMKNLTLKETQKIQKSGNFIRDWRRRGRKERPGLNSR